MMLMFSEQEETARMETLFDIPFYLCTLTDGIRALEEMIADRKPGLVVLANVHTLNLACEDRRYREVLKDARVIFRDGIGIEWAMKRKGAPGLHNFVGTDFIPAFCMQTAHKGYRVYLLGSPPDVCRKAAEELKSLAPGTVIAGYHHGYFLPVQTGELVNRINESRADILLVAMGNPKQELWIADNLHKLNVPVCIGVGALFDYLSGAVSRAPRWMLNAKMEWIYRLMTEPLRLWKRYMIGNPKFIVRVYNEPGHGKYH